MPASRAMKVTSEMSRSRPSSASTSGGTVSGASIVAISPTTIASAPSRSSSTAIAAELRIGGAAAISTSEIVRSSGSGIGRSSRWISTGAPSSTQATSMPARSGRRA